MNNIERFGPKANQEFYCGVVPGEYQPHWGVLSARGELVVGVEGVHPPRAIVLFGTKDVFVTNSPNGAADSGDGGVVIKQGSSIDNPERGFKPGHNYAVEDPKFTNGVHPNFDG